MNTPATRARRATRGLTFIEVMIGLAILAVLATLALPSLGGAAERARLKSAAETLAADFSEARFEAARRGAPLHVDLVPGRDWCWVVATEHHCPCGVEQACRLRSSSAFEHAGIELLDARSASFDAAGLAQPAGGAIFRSSRGEQLRVDVTPVGRARVCSPAGSVHGYPAC